MAKRKKKNVKKTQLTKLPAKPIDYEDTNNFKTFDHMMRQKYGVRLE